MPVNIGQGFLNDAKDSHLQIAGEPPKIGCHRKMDQNPGSLLIPLYEGPDCTLQAQFVQQRGVKAVGDRPDLPGALFGQVKGFRQLISPWTVGFGFHQFAHD